MINTFLNYIPGIIPVIVGIVAIALHIKTSKHNFAIENQKVGKNITSKWSIQWFDFVIISVHLAFIAFMNIYFLAGHHNDISLSTIVNGFTLVFIHLQNFFFKIDMDIDDMSRIKTIKI